MPLNIATVIEKARSITGSRNSETPADLSPDDTAIEISLQLAIRDINEKVGGAGAVKEALVMTTANQQDYVISTLLNDSNWQTIESVTRGSAVSGGGSGSALSGSEGVSVFGLLDCSLMEGSSTALIPMGLQAYSVEMVRRVINFERAEANSYEVIGGKLRLIPVPTGVQFLAVRYTTSTATLVDLPPKAEYALVFAACMAIMDYMLNNLPTRATLNADNGQAMSNQINLAKSQRDYYAQKYSAEFSRLR